MTDREGRSPCHEPERRQFDFWLGEWEVCDPDGKVVGHNSITRLYDGCALREDWRGESGHRGTSLNGWSPRDGAWHQTWVDSSGLMLQIAGGLQDGAMVMEGEAPLPGQGPGFLRHRISWSLIDGDPNRLRQHWAVATSSGDWETAFDGRYRRAG